MAKNERERGIDFTQYISERTTTFIGREWAFQAINDWLANPDGSRCFLLTGEPGSGKTAFAGRLFQFSQGTIPAPVGLSHLTPHFLSAVHFCSTRDTRWNIPQAFAESLAIQLARRYPAYAAALAEKSGERQIHIEVQQRFEQGSPIGVMINRLDASGVAPEDAFNRVVREPLEVLYHDGLNQQVIILVDALDEALVYSGATKIPSLLTQVETLPTGVRFVLTSRPEIDVLRPLRRAQPQELKLTSGVGLTQSLQDVHLYLLDVLEKNPALERKLTSDLSRQTLIKGIQEKSDGNFLYVRYLLNMLLEQQEQINLTLLSTLPKGLDGIYLEFLERLVKHDPLSWGKEYAAILGALAVAQVTLNEAQLADFIGRAQTELRDILKRLHQLLDVDETLPASQRTYAIYHRSFIDFLLDEDRSEEFWCEAKKEHLRLADWCEKGNLSNIWEDAKYSPGEQGRREYARKYYITHLYQAQECQRLFEVLDQGQYGREKVSYDPSTRAYAQDLDTGRRAAAWDGYTMEEGIGLLPQLWHYTLLRCTLTSRADSYPPAAFKLLMLLNQGEPKALGLVELLTDPSHKLEALLQIVEQIGKQPAREQEHLQILTRAWEIGRTINNDRITHKVAIAFAKARQWERVREVVHTIQDADQRAWVTRELVTALAQMQQWEQAETLIGTMEEGEKRAWAQSDLVTVFAKARLWEGAEALLPAIQGGEQRACAMRELVTAFAQVQLWEGAEAILLTVQDAEQRAWAQSELAAAFANAQLWERAEAMWAEAESLIQTIDGEQYWHDTVILGSESIGTGETSSRKDRVLEALGKTYIRTQQWERAQGTINLIKGSYRRIQALGDLGLAFAQAQYSERIENVVIALNTYKSKEEEYNSNRSASKYLVKLKKMTFTADLIISKTSAIFVELGKAFSQAQQQNRADAAWNKAEAIAYQDKDNSYYPQVLRDIGLSLARMHQWERAQAMIDSIEERDKQIEALSELGILLVQAQQLKQAKEVWAKAEGAINQVEQSEEQGKVLAELGIALAHEHQWELAQAVVHTVERHPQRVLALGELGKVFVQERQVELAQTVWDEVTAGTGSIVHDEQNLWVLEKLVEIFAETQQWERADEIVGLLGENDVDDSALNTLGRAYTRAQFWERAQAAILTINLHDTVNSYSDNRHEEVLNDLLEALLQGQQWRHAEELAHGLARDSDQLWALCNLGIELADAHMQERAEVILNEAEVLARTFTEDTQRVWSLSILGRALAQAQLQKRAESAWNEAEALIRTFANSIISRDREAYASRYDWVLEARKSALSALLAAFIDARLWERADALAHNIADTKERDSALSSLCIALIKAQLWERADAIVHTLEQPHEKVQALSELGTAYAQAYLQEQAKASWAEAEALISTITENKELESALSSLSIAFIQAQLWERAEAALGALQKSRQNITIFWNWELRQVVKALVRAGYWERAEAMADLSTGNGHYVYVDALREIATAMVAAGAYEQLLHMAQRLWLQTDDKEYAIKLLPLAYGLISRKPEIGSAFHDTFIKVDNFLK